VRALAVRILTRQGYTVLDARSARHRSLRAPPRPPRLCVGLFSAISASSGVHRLYR
jgi:hypothetical protein